ncbi:hypothetical protein GCM10023189_51650 [Nibrella saemangeumensis]|uniref:GLPGLI family protein n=1 Tax=Nibrella saemangeumensis TaxID=1084526 RepID=A0ABP8NLZ2_9BACT
MRIVGLLALICFVGVGAYGQKCVVSKDAKGRVVTICQMYFAQIEPRTTGLERPSYKEMVYLGSEYFGFPVWQDGTVQLAGRQIRGALAYNIITDELLYQLGNSTAVEKAIPEAFTIGGHRFIRDASKGIGRDSRYYMVLNNGPTRLLKSFKCQLRGREENNGYTKMDEFDGRYETQEQYYIKKGSAVPEPVTLTRKSLQAVLGDRADAITDKLPRRRITEENVIEVLKHYDGQMQ